MDEIYLAKQIRGAHYRCMAAFFTGVVTGAFLIMVGMSFIMEFMQ